MKYIIANWKANKNIGEVKQWIDVFKSFSLPNKDFHIILCPPYPFLLFLKQTFIDNNKVSIGAQDISRFETGTHTGEVTAKSLVHITDYVLIGHSERRRDYHESTENLQTKYNLALKYHIKPIYCFENLTDWIPENSDFYVYEPGQAISDGSGLGKNIPISQILSVKDKLNLASENIFIYGGSVNEKNAADYLKNPEIDGILPGGASLDPERFYKIISLV